MSVDVDHFSYKYIILVISTISFLIYIGIVFNHAVVSAYSPGALETLAVTRLGLEPETRVNVGYNLLM